MIGVSPTPLLTLTLARACSSALTISGLPSLAAVSSAGSPFSRDGDRIHAALEQLAHRPHVVGGDGAIEVDVSVGVRRHRGHDDQGR
jgi:hypothetical protein